MLNLQAIRDISAETGIRPGFIEKDWYAVQLLARLSSFQNSKGVSLIFSGGTSLSKGHGVIRRFSEDLDFILVSSSDISVGQRRALRQEILAHVIADDRFRVEDANVVRGDSHRFFKAPILYDIAFPDGSLRPYLQLEMTFSENRMPADHCVIRSIVSEVSDAEPEAGISCISPVETAADKLSALTWRVLVRDRSNPNDDPTIVRHLHDLAALEPVIVKSPHEFRKVSQDSMLQDRLRRGGEAISSLPDGDRLTGALEKMKQDSLYRDEYERFVTAMSYADDDDRIHFDDACSALERIVTVYHSSKEQI